MSTKKLPPPPEQWQGLTPALWSAEVSLWKIDESDYMAAAAYELNRERIRARCEQVGRETGDPEVCHLPLPWLALPENLKRSERYLNPMEPAPASMVCDVVQKLEDGTFRQDRSLATRAAREAAEAPANALFKIGMNESGGNNSKSVKGFVAAFSINPEASKSELIKAFSNWLDTEKIGEEQDRATGQRIASARAMLARLAIYRLRKSPLPGEWRTLLTGTDLQIWTDSPIKTIEDGKARSRFFQSLTEKPSMPCFDVELKRTEFDQAGPIQLIFPSD